jgi:hypothetical protein
VTTPNEIKQAILDCLQRFEGQPLERDTEGGAMTPRERIEQKVRQYAAEWSALLEGTITVERDPLDPQRYVYTVPVSGAMFRADFVEYDPSPMGCRR